MILALITQQDQLFFSLIHQNKEGLEEVVPFHWQRHEMRLIRAGLLGNKTNQVTLVDQRDLGFKHSITNRAYEFVCLLVVVTDLAPRDKHVPECLQVLELQDASRLLYHVANQRQPRFHLVKVCLLPPERLFVRQRVKLLLTLTSEVVSVDRVDVFCKVGQDRTQDIIVGVDDLNEVFLVLRERTLNILRLLWGSGVVLKIPIQQLDRYESMVRLYRFAHELWTV